MEKVREYIDQLSRFLREVKQEFKKITWPKKQEIISSTVLVILLAFVMAFFLGFVDITLQNLLSYLIQ